MGGENVAQRCPHCAERPMSRLQFLLVPGRRSTCRRCGRRIRVDVSRATMLLLVALGAVMGAAIVTLTDSVLELAIGLALAVLVAFALDQWAWSRLPWLSDEPAASVGADARALETADL